MSNLNYLGEFELLVMLAVIRRGRWNAEVRPHPLLDSTQVRRFLSAQGGAQ
jgi:hypothetical protein